METKSDQDSRTAVYAGTFDPVTNGHLDILYRAAQIFDRVIIAIAPNSHKGPLFSLEERMELIRECLSDQYPNIEVDTFTGLLVDYAKQQGAQVLVRGLRAVSDFEYEFQMTQMNRELDDNIETIFFMPTHDFFFTSSTIVKQVAQIDPERVEKFVPLNVAAAMKKRFNHL